MNRMIFVAIAIAALGAVGVTTSIMRVIPAYACCTLTTNGHETTTFTGGGSPAITTFNGHINNQLDPVPVNGGCKVTCINGNQEQVQGSPGFKATAGSVIC